MKTKLPLTVKNVVMLSRVVSTLLLNRVAHRADPASRTRDFEGRDIAAAMLGIDATDLGLALDDLLTEQAMRLGDDNALPWNTRDQARHLIERINYWQTRY